MKKAGLIFLVLVMPMCVFAASDDPVWRSDKADVTYLDIQRYIKENLPPDPAERARLLNNPKIYRDMAETLYTLDVLAAEAEAMPDFDREQAQWNAHIMYQRRIIKDYREKYLQQKMQGISWEKLAREDYQVNKQQYKSEEMVNVSHILIKPENAGGDEAALKLATEIRQRAIDGEDFTVLAKQYSQDPSVARNSGDLGFFGRNKMVKPFADVAFAMQKPGAISEVVRTPFGYHVIQFHARKAPDILPFETVQEQIIQKLKTDMGTQLWEEKLVAIRSDNKIQVDQKLLDELRTEFRTETSAN